MICSLIWHINEQMFSFKLSFKSVASSNPKVGKKKKKNKKSRKYSDFPGRREILGILGKYWEIPGNTMIYWQKNNMTLIYP